MIDEPSGKSHYGGDVAGPTFAQIMGGALRTMGIPPDAPLAPAKCPLQQRGGMTTVIDLLSCLKRNGCGAVRGE